MTFYYYYFCPSSFIFGLWAATISRSESFGDVNVRLVKSSSMTVEGSCDEKPNRQYVSLVPFLSVDPVALHRDSCDEMIIDIDKNESTEV